MLRDTRRAVNFCGSSRLGCCSGSSISLGYLSKSQHAKSVMKVHGTNHQQKANSRLAKNTVRPFPACPAHHGPGIAGSDFEFETPLAILVAEDNPTLSIDAHGDDFVSKAFQSRLVGVEGEVGLLEVGLERNDGSFKVLPKHFVNTFDKTLVLRFGHWPVAVKSVFETKPNNLLLREPQEFLRSTAGTHAAPRREERHG